LAEADITADATIGATARIHIASAAHRDDFQGRWFARHLIVAHLNSINAGEQRHAWASLSTIFSDKISVNVVLHPDRRERCDRSFAQSPQQARCFSLDRVPKPCLRLRQLSARPFHQQTTPKKCDAEGTDAVSIMSRVRVTMLRVRKFVLTDSPRTPGNIIRLIPGK
jgi:hypothetical protein